MWPCGTTGVRAFVDARHLSGSVVWRLQLVEIANNATIGATVTAAGLGIPMPSAALGLGSLDRVSAGTDQCAI
jgi:hypothetical protein